MFWDIFSRLCESKGISCSAACKAAGIRSTGSISQWKNGATPSNSSLKLLADYFDVTVSELLKEKEMEEPLEVKAPPYYSKLSPENRTLADMLIAKLFMAQK